MTGAGKQTGRLLTVSNRGPVEFHRDDDGKLIAVPGQGGLSTALTSSAQLFPTTWLSSPLTPIDRAMALGEIPRDADNEASRFVATDQEAYDLFYGVFSNEVLWFLQHGLEWPDELTDESMEKAWREGYLPVNRAFAEAIVAEIETGEYRAVMFHDYHFYAAPFMVRARQPNIYLQHFIHIPWPEPEVWKRLHDDVVVAMCEGLLANDSLVFQTPDSATNFIRTCQMYLKDRDIDESACTVRTDGRLTRVWSNGISVDPEELTLAAASPEFSRYRYLLRADSGQKMIVRVDRLDPTKNIVGGFDAFARLLEAHPELHEKVYFLAQFVPSRTDVPHYARHQEEVLALANAINERYGNLHWKPIRVLFEHNRVQALAAMSLYDVLLVNPFADGMNLVAKEGPLLNSHDGVLVLSRKAGAYAELGPAALGVDPKDIDGTATALYEALMMEPDERRERATRLRQMVRSRDLRDWFRILLHDIETNAPASSSTSAA